MGRVVSCHDMARPEYEMVRSQCMGKWPGCKVTGSEYLGTWPGYEIVYEVKTRKHV